MSAKKNRTIGNRLRQLRQARGHLHANSFARYLNIPASRWNNLERGFPLSKEVALLLVRKVPGLSLDWLYLGKTDGLSVRLGRALGAIPADEQQPARNSTTS